MGLGIVVVVYLIIVQGLGLVSTAGLDADYGEFPDRETVLRGITLPVGVSIAFGAVVVTILGWWPAVMRDNRPVQRWVWFVPAMLLVSALVVTDYGNLSDLGGGFTITLLLSSMLVGIGEELMFRGIGVTALRRNGLSEVRVALWSSVIFGGAHITNLITEGAGALLQVIVVSVSGYFFYLCRRVSGTIVVPMVLHGLWDFSLFSGHAGPDPDVYALGTFALLANIILAVVLWVRRHQIEPGTTSPETLPAT